MGKQRYWLFKTVFTENNQFERIIPATGDVRDKRSVSPLCSTPRNPLASTRRASPIACSTPLIISRLIEIGKRVRFSSVIRFQPVPFPFVDARGQRWPRRNFKLMELDVDANLTDGRYGKYGDGNFSFLFFFFFDDRWDCLEEKKNFRVVC